jgi:hypothetical protein
MPTTVYTTSFNGVFAYRNCTTKTLRHQGETTRLAWGGTLEALPFRFDTENDRFFAVFYDGDRTIARWEIIPDEQVQQMEFIFGAKGSVPRSIGDLVFDCFGLRWFGGERPDVIGEAAERILEQHKRYLAFYHEITPYYVEQLRSEWGEARLRCDAEGLFIAGARYTHVFGAPELWGHAQLEVENAIGEDLYDLAQAADLHLTEKQAKAIYNRIVALALPAFGAEHLRRRVIKVVHRFLGAEIWRAAWRTKYDADGWDAPLKWKHIAQHLTTTGRPLRTCLTPQPRFEPDFDMPY